MSIESAQKAMRDGRLADARVHLEALVADSDAGPEIHYNLAMVQSRLQDFQAAATSFKHCARFAPTNPDILNNLANALRLSGQLDESAQVFNKAIRNNPRHPALRCNRGWLHLISHKHDAAVADFRAALASDDDIEDAWRGLAESLLAAGDMNQAESVSRQALEKFSSSANLHNLRGVFHIRQRQPERALPCFKQSVKIFPSNPEALTNLGITAEQIGDLPLAEQSLSQALAVKPGHAPAWFHLCNLASWQPTAEHIPAIEAALESASNDGARAELEFALAKALAKLMMPSPRCSSPAAVSQAERVTRSAFSWVL